MLLTDENQSAVPPLVEHLQTRLHGVHQLIEFSSQAELENFNESVGSDCVGRDGCDQLGIANGQTRVEGPGHERLGHSVLGHSELGHRGIHDLVTSAIQGDDAVESLDLGRQTLLATRVAPYPGERLIDGEPIAVLLSLVGGPAELVESTAHLAIETWNLQRGLEESNAAAQESAMQLAQSYEEQTWLRGFAHGVSNFSRINGANELASGIVSPLPYLLSAEAVFLLVDPAEQKRSGLEDVVFGESKYTLDEIQQLLRAENIGPDSPPFVRNNCLYETVSGEIKSLIIVPVRVHDQFSGHLVGINRSLEFRADGMPLYDPEFGSNEVGLMEEAAVLLATQANNVHLLMQSNKMFLGSLHAMSKSIDARDAYTQGHSQRVARLAYELAVIHDCSPQFCHEVYLSGILHDVGKIGIPDAVLLKAGKLDDDEFAIIKQHPMIGFNIIKEIEHLEFTLPGIRSHHERWDGRGYPDGLAGEEIPLMARFLAVADAFDAMTSSRPYRNAMPVEKARSIINGGADEQWDGRIIASLEKWIGKQDLSKAANGESLVPSVCPSESIVTAAMTLRGS